MSDKVSVNIITYNQEDFIAETIDSVLSQTYPNIEILISDDCSTDQTLEICKQYQKKFPDKIKILSFDENKGLPKNASQGLQAMTGDYYISLGGDDLMLPNSIEEQVKNLNKHPKAVLSHCNALWFESDSGEILRKHHKKIVPETSLKLLQRSNIIAAICAVVRKEYLPDSYRDGAGSVCDWLFYAEVLQHGDGAYIHQDLIKYRRHEKNISNDYKMHLDALKALNLMKKHCSSVFPDINLGYASQYRSMIKKNLMVQRYYKAMQFSFLYGYHKLQYAFSLL